MILTALTIASALAISSTRPRIVRPDTMSSAQLIGSVRGTVADSAGDAISGATVLIDQGEVTTHSRADGTFGRFRLIPARHRVTVSAPGYQPVGADFTLAASGDIHLWITMVANQAILPAIHIRAKRDFTSDKSGPDRGGFAHRRATGTGRYLDDSAIAVRGYPPLVELLRDVPGVQLFPVQTAFGTSYQIQMRGGAGFKFCPIQFYLDGQSITPDETPATLGDLGNTRTIGAIEVYPGPSSVPPQFSGANASCGVVVLWSKSAADLSK